MIGRIRGQLTLAWLTWIALAVEAAAQRPPTSSEPSKGGMSIEKTIAWIQARPGVIAAVVLIVAALLYMYFTRSKAKT